MWVIKLVWCSHSLHCFPQCTNLFRIPLESERADLQNIEVPNHTKTEQTGSGQGNWESTKSLVWCNRSDIWTAEKWQSPHWHPFWKFPPWRWRSLWRSWRHLGPCFLPRLWWGRPLWQLWDMDGEHGKRDKPLTDGRPWVRSQPGSLSLWPVQCFNGSLLQRVWEQSHTGQGWCEGDPGALWTKGGEQTIYNTTNLLPHRIQHAQFDSR